MTTILKWNENRCQISRAERAYDRLVMVINRFVVEHDVDAFRGEIERARSVLAAQKGYVDGTVGRNVDDPTRWVLTTRWEGPGAYRRALSAYDVKVEAWPVLGRAVDEPSAYETLEPGERANDARPRVTD